MVVSIWVGHGCLHVFQDGDVLRDRRGIYDFYTFVAVVALACGPSTLATMAAMHRRALVWRVSNSGRGPRSVVECWCPVRSVAPKFEQGEMTLLDDKPQHTQRARYSNGQGQLGFVHTAARGSDVRVAAADSIGEGEG